MVESPWWLVAKQRYEEAEHVLEKIAKWNKVPVTRICLRQHDHEHNTTPICTDSDVETNNEHTPLQVKGTHKCDDVTVKLSDLVQDPVLLKVSLISIVLWSVHLEDGLYKNDFKN